MNNSSTINKTDHSNDKSRLRQKKRGNVYQVFERLTESKTAMVGLVVIIFIILASILGPFLTKYGYNEMNLALRYQAPSLNHWFGTDSYGRDVFTRILMGGRYSLLLGLSGALFGLTIGVVLGSIDGFIGGNFDTVFMRLIDIWGTIPSTLLAIIISTVLGPGFVNTILALSLSNIPYVVRLLRAQILSVRGEEYLEAARSIDCGPFRIMFKHMLPNVIAPAIVNTTMEVGTTILNAASLSYLGLGIQPPMAEWGAMLSESRDYYTIYPWLMIFPGIAIMLFVLAVNMFGDGLRDAIDPKLKR